MLATQKKKDKAPPQQQQGQPAPAPDLPLELLLASEAFEEQERSTTPTLDLASSEHPVRGTSELVDAPPRSLGGVCPKKLRTDPKTDEEWMLKQPTPYAPILGPSISQDAASVREVYAAKLYQMLSSGPAAEGCVFDGGGLHTGSKMIPELETWQKLQGAPVAQTAPLVPKGSDQFEHKGLASSLATAAFLGDTDMNLGNVGCLEAEGVREYLKIDFGHAFQSDVSPEALLDVSTLPGGYPTELMNPKELEVTNLRLATVKDDEIDLIANQYEPWMAELGAPVAYAKELKGRRDTLAKLLFSKQDTDNKE